MPAPTTLSSNIQSLAAALATASIAVVDFETSGVKTFRSQIAGLGLYLPESQRAFYINVGHAAPTDQYPRQTEAILAQVLTPFVMEPANHLVAHNATFELRFLLRMGLDIRCRVSCSMIHTHRTDENLRNRGKEKVSHYYTDVSYGLKELTIIFFDEQPPTITEATLGKSTTEAPVNSVATYCVLDCYNTWRLYDRARIIINADNQLRVITETIDDPNLPILSKMMAEGILINAEEAMAQASLYDHAIQECREHIWLATQTTQAIDTPREMLRLLRLLNITADINYDPFYLPFFEGESDPSVGREVLLETFQACADSKNRLVLALFIAKTLMEQRLSSFLRPMPFKVLLSEGRLYPDNFSSTLVTTRFSCSPNLQNMPRKMGTDGDVDEDEEWISVIPESCRPSATTKNIFVAKPGHTLVSMDLSAAEPRYLSLLFQRAITQRDSYYIAKKAQLKAWRQDAYGWLLQIMRDTANPFDPSDATDNAIPWPDYPDGIDPLYRVFKYGLPVNDPYNAFLIAMDPQGYQQAISTNSVPQWFDNERWRGKRAFLALGYGSTAENLYKPLGWSLERTQQAITSLETTYATLNPLREITLREIKHTGEVRSLWGRPRRINGYYQLSRPEPVTIGFYRKLGDGWQQYEADIIPLGTTTHAVQAFVSRAYIVSDNGKTGEIVLQGDETSGSVIYRSAWDRFANADHFNNPPFRNISFSQIKWVRDANGLTREVPRQARAQRQAVNAMCQSTGADHLRWLMNNMDQQVCQSPAFSDCKLVLTIHDSLIFEVPDDKVGSFVAVARPIMQARPPWADIDMKVGIEVGKSFGEMHKVATPTGPATP